MIKYKEAELIVNKMLVDFLNSTKASEGFLADMSEKDVAKVARAMDKYRAKLTKLQSTLIANLEVSE